MDSGDWRMSTSMRYPSLTIAPRSQWVWARTATGRTHAHRWSERLCQRLRNNKTVRRLGNHQLKRLPKRQKKLYRISDLDSVNPFQYQNTGTNCVEPVYDTVLMFSVQHGTFGSLALGRVSGGSTKRHQDNHGEQFLRRADAGRALRQEALRVRRQALQEERCVVMCSAWA